MEPDPFDIMQEELLWPTVPDDTEWPNEVTDAEASRLWPDGE
jgi:hypothetical protein